MAVRVYDHAEATGRDDALPALLVVSKATDPFGDV